nr:FMN-binding protein [uncultured Blautia sp.]
MKYQSFIMRVLCLILIVGVVLGYNSMQKKDSDTEKDQQIASLTTRVEALEKQQDEILSAIEEAAKAQEEAKKKAEEEAKNKKDSAAKEDADAADKAAENQADADSEADSSDEAEESEDLAYKNGTYTGDGQGFGGNIQVQVTLENDTITDIQVVSAPGEDSAYLSQGQGVISTILAAQSTDVDTISGATFSSTGIINAVNDALGKAENQ